MRPSLAASVGLFMLALPFVSIVKTSCWASSLASSSRVYLGVVLPMVPFGFLCELCGVFGELCGGFCCDDCEAGALLFLLALVVCCSKPLMSASTPEPGVVSGHSGYMSSSGMSSVSLSTLILTMFLA